MGKKILLLYQTLEIVEDDSVNVMVGSGNTSMGAA